MKRILAVAALSAIGAACGGGGGGVSFRDPDAASFSYDTPRTPDSTEQEVATSGEGAVADTLAFVAEGDEAAAQDQALSLAMFANEASGVFPGDVPFPASRAEAAATVSQVARAYLSGEPLAVEGPSWDDPGCWTVTATSLTFDGCSVTEDSTDGSMTLALNGAVHRSAGSVDWDLTISATGSGDGLTLRFSDRLRGDVAYTASTLAGFSRSDISLFMSDGVQRVSGAVTYNADLDLTLEGDPACVTDGTLTLKRLWAQRPDIPDADPAEFTDASVQVTWLGCGSVNVAWGTPD
jgi:hypothetical protein